MADNIKLVTKEYVDTSIDDRSQFQKLIDEYDLTQRAYVDLTGLSTDRFYYDDFVTCVTDLNNDVTTSSVAKADSNVCVLIPFTYDDKKAYLLQLLAKVEITAPLLIMKSTIIDLNGFELYFVGIGKFGNAKTFYSGAEFMIYGAGLNSIISADPQTETSNALSILQTCFTNNYYIGGKYIVNVTKFNKNNYIYDRLIADTNTTLEKHSINIYNVDIEYTISLDYTKIATPKYSSVIHIASNAEVILNMYNSTIHAHCDLTNTIRVDIIAGNYTYKGNYTLKDCYLRTTCNDNITITDGEDMICLGGSGNYTIINCNIQGRYLAASIIQKGYISGSYFSGGHGLYCANNPNTLVGANVYIQDSTFEYSPETSPNGSAAMYVGYGSKAFVDNCTFILPDSTGTSFAVRAAETPEGQVSQLYISNSSFTKPRVDAGQEIYYGEGISQEMRDYTVAGTKYNTTDNYSTYTKENPFPIVDLEYNEISRNAQSGIAVKQAIDTGLSTKQDIINENTDLVVNTLKIDTLLEAKNNFLLGNSDSKYIKVDFVDTDALTFKYDDGTGDISTVQLKGIKAGSDNTDAVNVSQLNSKVSINHTTLANTDRVYGVNSNNNETLFKLDAGVTANTIALRMTDGTLRAVTPTADSVDNTVTTKKYVDDAIGNITALFASLVDMTKTTQSDEPVDDTEIVNDPTDNEEETVNA